MGEILIFLDCVLISILLRYQGQKYAEIENENLCRKFYAKKVKETKTINISRLGGNRGFANANVSRPRQCPYCRAEGTIVKASNGRDWECSTDRDGCGYKWGGK